MKVNEYPFYRNQALINGSWTNADDGSTFAVDNPATGEIISEIANCGQRETQRAIDAAEQALPGWRSEPAKSRAALLRAWYNLIMDNQRSLAELLTLEQGKPLAEAMGEIAYGASYIEWFAEETKRVYGDTIPAPSADKRIMVVKQPIGVVACITPWNFPNAMLTRKIAPALAAGCTVVCKPANETPLSALAAAQLALDAGIPAGVINILCGRTEEIGATLTASPVVRKLTFTGSTAVGKKLAADCATTMKRTTMELGGNAPLIVFNDAHIESAIAGTLASKYRNAGQTCVCANRILVQSNIYDTFVSRLQDEVSQYELGDGLAEGTTMGPLIHGSACDKVDALVSDAIEKGATLTMGCERNNNFIVPGILTDVTPDMRVAQEEIFGPVAAIIRFDTEEEAIALANNTNAGLAAYVFTENAGLMFRISEALEYGIIGVNEGIISNEMAPFGGVKESGNGREGSKYGLDDYLEIKYICIGGLDR